MNRVSISEFICEACGNTSAYLDCNTVNGRQIDIVVVCVECQAEESIVIE